MKAKYILTRRLFNPSDKEKDIRTLVATFGRFAVAEAKFCLDMLQRQATKFDDKTYLGKYRYTLEVVPDAPGKNKPDDLRLDDSKARKTGRAFPYELTWDTKHKVCHMIAYHKLFGSVRAEVADTIEARHWFMRALKRVWPNAYLSTK